jgi:hypothetical protein
MNVSEQAFTMEYFSVHMKKAARGRFEDLVVTSMKTAVFCDVASCRLVDKGDDDNGGSKLL